MCPLPVVRTPDPQDGVFNQKAQNNYIMILLHITLFLYAIFYASISIFFAVAAVML